MPTAGSPYAITGGGNRRKYRLIDFKRNTEGEGSVLSIEYDPNRSANIALVKYENGRKAYIIAPDGLKAGDSVSSGESADIKPGNCLPLSAIPLGTMVHNVELNPGRGAQLAVRPECPLRSWPRRTDMPSSGSRPERSAW